MLFLGEAVLVRCNKWRGRYERPICGHGEKPSALAWAVHRGLVCEMTDGSPVQLSLVWGAKRFFFLGVRKAGCLAASEHPRKVEFP
jgi:hypothetical protein